MVRPLQVKPWCGSGGRSLDFRSRRGRVGIPAPPVHPSGNVARDHRRLGRSRSGAGAFSPFNFANSVIGRAYTLTSFNFGNAKINENFTATFGNVTNYNNMFAGENEEESPWAPLHVEKGFKPEESTASLFRGWNINHLGMGSAGQMANRMLDALNGMQSMIPGGTFILDPLTAKNLKRLEGFKTKEEFRQWLLDRIKKPAGPFPMRAVAINLVVVGGEWIPMFTTTDFTYTQTVSIDKWVPKKGICFDAKPIRMPALVTCKDGICGIH